MPDAQLRTAEPPRQLFHPLYALRPVVQIGTDGGRPVRLRRSPGGTLAGLAVRRVVAGEDRAAHEEAERGRPDAEIDETALCGHGSS